MKLLLIATCLVSLPMTFVHSSPLEDGAMDKYQMFRSFVEKEDLSDEVGACEVQFEKVGCFRDHPFKKRARALPELLFNDRDKIEWYPAEKWNDFLKRLACRCAQASNAKGRGYFGLQFYGECWSTGPGAEPTYDRYGPSKRCAGYNYSKCNDNNSEECVGGGFTNYVYKIADGGSGGGQLFLA